MDARFYRSQAALCRRIGRRMANERIARELIEIADEFAARAAFLAAEDAGEQATTAPEE